MDPETPTRADPPPAGTGDETTPVPGPTASAGPDAGPQASEPPPGPRTGAGVHAAAEPGPGGWAGLGRALRPAMSASQILVGLLCAVLGFALVVQLGQNNRDQYASLRQGDLVRLLDDVTDRSAELEAQVDALRSTRDDLASGAERQQDAQDAARAQAQTQGILSGRLPAEGPGVTIDIVAPAPLKANVLVNVLEELRNAGAEVIEVNGVRLTTTSYFTDTSAVATVDGIALTSPIQWTAIGDPQTIATALTIHGGAVDALTDAQATTTITPHDLVQVTATVQPPDPQYATPAG